MKYFLNKNLYIYIKHFLCNNKKYYPKLIINLNLSYLNTVEKICDNFLKFTAEHIKLQSRKEYNDEKSIKQQDLLLKLQHDASERFKKYQKEVSEEKRIANERKREQLDFLKEQMETDFRRKQDEKNKIKKEDEDYMKNIVNRNAEMTEKQNKLEEELKEEILQEYAALNKDAELREIRAKSHVKELSTILSSLKSVDLKQNESNIRNLSQEDKIQNNANEIEFEQNLGDERMEVDIPEDCTSSKELSVNNIEVKIDSFKIENIEKKVSKSNLDQTKTQINSSNSDLPLETIYKSSNIMQNNLNSFNELPNKNLIRTSIKLHEDRHASKTSMATIEAFEIENERKITLFKERNKYSNDSQYSQMQNIIYNRADLKSNTSESISKNEFHLQDNKNKTKKYKNTAYDSSVKFETSGNHENQIELDEKQKNERFLFFTQKDNRVDLIRFDDIIKPYSTTINDLFDKPISTNLLSLELVNLVKYNIYLADEFIEKSNYKFKTEHVDEFLNQSNVENECFVEAESPNTYLALKNIYTFNYIEIDDILNRILFKPIQLQSDLVNKCLINYFLFELNLEDHLEAIRKYFLFENGEFAQVFVDQLAESIFSIDFNRSQSAIGTDTAAIRLKLNFKNLLNPIYVYEALNKAVSQVRNCKFIDNLSIRINNDCSSKNNASSNKYVDILTYLNSLELKYLVGFPLNLIINETTIASYNKIFGFLLQIKFVLSATNNVWYTLKRFSKLFPFIVNFKNRERKTHILKVF